MAPDDRIKKALAVIKAAKKIKRPYNCWCLQFDGYDCDTCRSVIKLQEAVKEFDGKTS